MSRELNLASKLEFEPLACQNDVKMTKKINTKNGEIRVVFFPDGTAKITPVGEATSVLDSVHVAFSKKKEEEEEEKGFWAKLWDTIVSVVTAAVDFFKDKCKPSASIGGSPTNPTFNIGISC